jgi:hypothetical protein
MRDHDTRTVRQLLVALRSVEDELRTARSAGDLDRLTDLIRRKRSALVALRRRRLLRTSVA